MARLPGAICAALVVGICGARSFAAAEPSFPIVPGYHVLKESGKVEPAVLGELLLGELTCASCHSAGEGVRVVPKGGPDLTDVATRVTPQYLQGFLNDPHGLKSGTTMPDLLHGMAPDEKAKAAEALAHFLIDQSRGATDEAPGSGTPELVKQGGELYHTVGCAACHTRENAKRPTTVPSVPLGELAEKTTVTALTAFLLDPTHARPAGRMPAMGLTPTEARAVAVYLLRRQLDSKTAATQPLPGTGLNVAYYEDNFTTAKPEVFEKLKPKVSTQVKTFTLDFAGRKEKNHFGLKFTGWIWIPQAGAYTFNLKSDDGSILLIDSKPVVNSDGKHPAKGKTGDVELTAGMHPLQLTYYQDGANLGLEVLWKGPGFEERPVPAEVLAAAVGKSMLPSKGGTFVVDPAKVDRGSNLFETLGCQACHPILGHRLRFDAMPLAKLNPDAAGGCLSEKPGANRPRFGLSADQRSAMSAALKNSAAFSTPREPAERALLTLAAMNCLACHQRDGIGGVEPARNDLFKVAGNFDVGDEGRLPPRLTGVGAKLQRVAIERIVFDRQLHVRGYMATRMPNYPRGKLPGLAELLVKADPPQPDPAVPTPQILAAQQMTGRTLVGVRGYGCVNCHGAKGVKSLGAPSVDLGVVRERLRADWFARLLADPNKMNPGTRMPAFWPEGEAAIKDIAGGTFAGQSTAIWSYLQRVEGLALPDGLRLNGSDEIVPTDEPIVLRAFVTGVSPRSILVGTPEGVHCVFDANSVRLAKAWRGRFFDAKGIWEARGGRAEAPMGTDVIDLPAGPSFAVLDSMAAPWPEITKEWDRNLGGKFLGYTLDEKQRPTFRYQTDDILVEEKPLPKGSGEQASLARQFKVTSRRAVRDLYFMLAAGKQIQNAGGGVWKVDGKVSVRLIAPGLGQAQLRDGKDGVQELLLPVEVGGKPVNFTVEESW